MYGGELSWPEGILCGNKTSMETKRQHEADCCVKVRFRTSKGNQTREEAVKKKAGYKHRKQKDVGRLKQWRLLYGIWSHTFPRGRH